MKYSGTVIHGDSYGHALGFPTANLDPKLLAHVEKAGVYTCVVHLGSQNYGGVLYLGPRITLGETKRVLEIHLLDFNQDIYGQVLTFEIGSFIRPPMDFSSVDELKNQLRADITAARGPSQ